MLKFLTSSIFTSISRDADKRSAAIARNSSTNEPSSVLPLKHHQKVIVNNMLITSYTVEAHTQTLPFLLAFVLDTVVRTTTLLQNYLIA